MRGEIFEFFTIRSNITFQDRIYIRHALIIIEMIQAGGASGRTHSACAQCSPSTSGSQGVKIELEKLEKLEKPILVCTFVTLFSETIEWRVTNIVHFHV